MAKTLLSLAWVLVLAVLSGPCGAWNKPGHVLGGAIAYNELMQSHAEVVERIATIMKSHPKAVLFDADLNSVTVEAERTAALFMYMATWAEDIRGVREYDHPKWHYVNIPYVPSEPGDQSNGALRGPGNILNALSINVGIVRDPQSSRRAKGDRSRLALPSSGRLASTVERHIDDHARAAGWRSKRKSHLRAAQSRRASNATTRLLGQRGNSHR